MVGSPGKPFSGPFKGEEKDSVGYFPYATIAWDYINRAMPVPQSGIAHPDEVYALVAFLLYRNGIINETDVMDEQEPAEGRDAEPERLRSGKAGVSAGTETQLVVSAGPTSRKFRALSNST